jgi:ABC-type sugar transport system ATPase subunit
MSGRPDRLSDVLEMRHIVKDFPGVRALDSVDFELRAGEIHAIVGENGAGKSTLMKILGGVYLPDSGEIYLQGKVYDIVDPRHARLLGIAVVHQELSLFPGLSVSENILAGEQPVRGPLGIVDRQGARTRATRVLAQFELDIDTDIPVRSLSIAYQQVVEIARALLQDARILVLDEPTSALTEKEKEMLFKAVRGLKESGYSVIYISHRLQEVFEIADRITVLRDGKKVDTVSSSSVDIDGLIRMMVGRTLTDFFGRNASIPGEELLRVSELSRGGRFRDISFFLRRGEILGFAGLVGAGRTELARVLFGVDRADTGTITLKGKEIHLASPGQAIRSGLAYVSENRRVEGLFRGMAVRANIVVTHLRDFSQFGLMRKKAEEASALESVRRLRIQTPDVERAVSNLSGGNQQKVVLARWLAVKPEVLIVDEPTRGIDVGAKAEIYALLRNLAAQGMGIILISSELPEVLGMSDRIAVLYEGRMTGIIPKSEASQERIMALAAGFSDSTEKGDGG